MLSCIFIYNVPVPGTWEFADKSRRSPYFSAVLLSSWLLSRPAPSSGSLKSMAPSSVCTFNNHVHVRKHRGNVGPPAPGVVPLCPFACALRAYVPDTGLLFCQRANLSQIIMWTHSKLMPPASSHSGETLLTCVLVCTLCCG